jgi:1,4-alpha-glucan branching enzyme
MSSPEAQRAQVFVAVENYRKHFDRSPRGIWLPECAFEPGIEDILKDAGIEYFIADTHAILYGDPRPRFGVHAPVMCPNGTAVFARDLETSQQVWSAEVGYPGAAAYREFYRDIGWDLPLDYLLPYLDTDGNRKHLGLKYHRITGRAVPQHAKEPYHPSEARRKAAEDASHFVRERIAQAIELRNTFEGHPPLVVSPYDAELFGHWWFEGPQFLDFFFRALANENDAIAAVTPGDFLDAGIPIQIQEPTASSWGENGYYKVWINQKNSWMYPYQHDAEQRMTEAADRFNDNVHAPSELQKRILDQMARELLLAQSSDWAFQIYQGTTVEYSTRRFTSHIQRFDLLAGLLESVSDGRGSVPSNDDQLLLAEIEGRDNIFSEIDFKVFRTSPAKSR